MKSSYVTAIIVPTISVSLFILTLLASILIYRDFSKDLTETISFTLKEDESILLAVANQPEFQMKDLYLSYALKGMSFSFFDNDKIQLHPKTPIDNEVFKLLRLNPQDKRFYILSKKGSRSILNIVTRLEISKQNIAIISQKNLSYLYSGLLDDIAIGILLLVIGSIILGILLYKVSLKLILPLRNLIFSAEYISSGHYSERVSLGGLREIDEVGIAFNKMAAEIEEKIDVLQIENDKKELFISGFTHELKTPLTNIIGYSDHLIRRDLSPVEIMNSLDVINREGKRLNVLGVYLRDYILRDHSLIKLKLVSLDVISRDIRDTSLRMLSDLNIKLEISYTEGSVLINRELYLTCCINILQNAVKASKPETTIDIFLEIKGRMFKSVFIDRGSGIPSDELSKIIKPFFQGKSVCKSDNKQNKGFGLGLFIVDRIIREGFKGALNIESISGEYTKVTIKLPMNNNNV